MNKFEKDYRKELKEQKKKSKKFSKKYAHNENGPIVLHGETKTSYNADVDWKEYDRIRNRNAWIKIIILSILVGTAIGFTLVSLTN